ncbi:MAG: 16S rRNA (cytidine(1402)-2'-O)-methyltransferase [Clostridia bacterium]|nr:16S rRNA (cytidine(1402)-2'-O)-methyltransferase [Clostridia bacterium]
MPGTLTLVGTPIGNLSDFSPRAIEALEACDFIAAEDTRVSLTLLNHFGIRKPLISYFEHNKRERGEAICRKLEDGENAVLVTDAGMPAISDPGEDLVALCHERGIPVTVIPGPSAGIAALAVSGLPTARFTFEGFLSTNRRDRRDRLDSLKVEQRTMVFYEAPHKLLGTLEDLLTAFGDRRICLARELTKLHEEIVRTTLTEAVTRYREAAPRGEFVLVIKGAAPAEDTPLTPEEAAKIALVYVKEGLSTSDAAKKAAAETGVKKGDIYRLLTKES